MTHKSCVGIYSSMFNQCLPWVSFFGIVNSKTNLRQFWEIFWKIQFVIGFIKSWHPFTGKVDLQCNVSDAQVVTDGYK